MAPDLGARLSTAGRVVRSRFGLWLLLVAGFTLGYYLLLMASLVVRFGALPNYAIAYNWPASVWKIFRSTPSFRDVPPIVAEEYLLEFGYMNYDYGLGISEWALNIIPYKVLLVMVLAALLAANILLLKARTSCSGGTRLKSAAATGLGAGFVALTSATMSWVVCCATPTWIVGLSMLGLGVSTAFWIEPIGPWLTMAGYGLLALSTLGLAEPAATSRFGTGTPGRGRKTSSQNGVHA
ncbi:hypothetical protein [Roseibium salinum]|uniref:DUF2029 domain-containing protein n=2 Tax=Roseibium salinum TaxID=1604349 RepID=A0ABT3QVL5_9HYPH|nr:hypothetical protein [Roseibium sp. DSM 29163]MCX2720952.1 hypothetical protein [Roseibium sp. DSM 29163]